MHIPTAHALRRQQQRGISAEVISYLLGYGSSVKAGGGAQKYFFDKAAKGRLACEEGRATLKMLGGKLACYCVADGNVVITVGHRTKKIKR